jgi:hypothetical protein
MITVLLAWPRLEQEANAKFSCGKVESLPVSSAAGIMRQMWPLLQVQRSSSVNQEHLHHGPRLDDARCKTPIYTLAR